MTDNEEPSTGDGGNDENTTLATDRFDSGAGQLLGHARSTDLEDELEEVTEPVFESATVIPLNLQSDEAEAVRRIAEVKGIADAELIRGWVREKIHAG